MTRDEARRIDDQIQEEMVAQQNADIAEAGDLGDLLLLLLTFVVAIAILASIVVAWVTTGDARFGWALLVTGVGILGGYAYLFRKTPGGAS